MMASLLSLSTKSMANQCFTANRHVLFSCLALLFVVMFQSILEAQIFRRPIQQPRQQNVLQPTAQPIIEANESNVARLDLIEQEATGVGRNQREALNAAWSEAVSSVLGMSGVERLLIENSELKQNEVRTFSGGFVASYDTIRGPTVGADGMVEITILAKVRRNAPDSELREISAGRVNWQDFSGEVSTRTRSRDDGIAVLKFRIERHLMDCISTVVHTDFQLDRNRRGVLEIRTTVDNNKYNSFVRDFTDDLGRLGIRSSGNRLITLEQREVNFRSPAGPRGRVTVMRTTDRGQPLTASTGGNGVLYIARAQQGRGQQMTFDRYDLPRDVFAAIQDSLFKILEHRRGIVELRDVNGRILDNPDYHLFVPFHNKSEDRPIFIFPLLATTDLRMRVWENPDDGFFPGTPEYRNEIELNISPSDLIRIHTHRLRFE